MKFTVIALAFCAVLAAIYFTSSTDAACPCQQIYKPVCSTDGVTYPNNCTLDCESAEFAYSGTCDGDELPQSLGK